MTTEARERARALLREHAARGSAPAEALRDVVELAKREVDAVLLEAAGDLAARAWADLAARAALLARDLPAPAAPMDGGADPWGAFNASTWARGTDAVATERLSRDVVLQPRLRGTPERKSTLLDLVHALDDAVIEAERRLARRAAVDALRAARRGAGMAAHEEDLAADVARVAAQLGGAWCEMRALAPAGAAGRVSVLQAVLHLVREGRAEVSQGGFPFGPILVRRGGRL